MKIWYNIIDAGDGSVFTSFYESQELAEFSTDVEMETCGEYWAEDCINYLEVESDSPIKVLNIITKEDMLSELKEAGLETLIEKLEAL